MSVLSNELVLPAYDGLSDAECLAALQQRNIPAKQPITSHDIKAYLNVVDKRLTIIDSATTAARKATLALDDFESFDMGDPAYAAKLTQVLDDLVAADLLIADDKAAILAMGDKFITRLEELKIPHTRLGHVQRARATA
jgi:hypothetical protein